MDTLLRRRSMIADGGGSPTPPTPTPEFHSYLVFDGVASIQTDLVLPTNGSIRVTIGGETTKGVQGIFNAKNIASDTVTFGLWMNSSSNTTKRVFACRYNANTTDSSHPSINSWDNRPGLFITPTRWGYGTTGYTHSKGSVVADGGILIGAEAGGIYYTGKLGWFYIYDSSAQAATTYNDLRDNYTPLVTLKPCVLNGECGYYDEASGKFYGNTAGAGTLSVDDV